MGKPTREEMKMGCDFFVQHDPDTQGALEAYTQRIGVKRGLLIKAFGVKQIDQMETEIESNSVMPIYLNKWGANVHFSAIGGDASDPIYSFIVSGHHHGEAFETVRHIAALANHTHVMRA